MRYCRLTPNKKLPDRFLFSGIIETPNHSLSICYIIEVTKPWFPTSRVAPVIINELKSNLSIFNSSTDISANFEEMLKGVNEALFDLSEQGETEWIGNLNSLVVLIKDQEIFLSQTGSLPGYLFRQQKINQITEGLALEQETHPLKTFSSIISGKIEEGDRILLANHELFNVLSLDMLRQIIVNNSPYQACLSILRSLKKHNTPAVSSIIIHFADYKNQGIEPDCVMVEEGFEKWYKKAWRVIKPGIIKTGQSIKENTIRAHGVYKEKLSPKIQAAGQFTREQVIPKVKDRVFKLIIHRQPDQEAKIKETLSAQKKIRRTGFLSSNFQRIQNFSNNKFTWNSLKTVFNLRTLLIVSALLLVIIAFFLIRNHNPKTTTKSTEAEQNTLIKTIEADYAAAVKYKDEGEKEKAIEKLQSIIKSAKKPGTDLSSKTTVIKKVEDLLDQLTSTVHLPISDSIKFSSNKIDQIELISPYFFACHSEDGRLFRQAKGSLESSKEKSINFPKEISRGVADIISNLNSDNNSLSVLSGDGQLFSITQSGTETKVTEVSYPLGKFATADAVESYLGNLYLLDGSTGLLWKYPKSNNSYGKGINQVDINSVDIKNGVSLAIDGHIYVLKSNGKVVKLLKGIPEQNFNLQELPDKSKIKKPLKIFTSANTTSLFILDAGAKDRQVPRLIEFDKNGNYLKQYHFPNKISAIKDAIMRIQDNKLYLLSDSVIYQLSIQ